MQEGKIKWFSEQKGFGFLESGGKDYFVHYKEILGNGFKNLREGDKVSFEPTQTAKGSSATKVTLLKAAEPSKSFDSY